MALAFRTGQSVTASAVASPATTGNFASTPGAGQLIVVVTGDDSATTTSVSSVFDNKGNTYYQVLDIVLSATLQVWYAIVTNTSATFNVSANWNTGTTGRCVVLAQEFNGFVGRPRLDGNVTTTGNGTGTAASSGTSVLATRNANSLIVGAAVHASTTSAFTLGAGYTNLNTINVANAATAMESKVVAATGTQAATFTIAASRTWNAAVLAFYDDIAASATNVRQAVNRAGTY